jgi:hypothetical protein
MLCLPLRSKGLRCKKEKTHHSCHQLLAQERGIWFLLIASGEACLAHKTYKLRQKLAPHVHVSL